MRHARSDYDRFQDPDGRIPDDEPVFLLRGQDPVAPDTLRFWADQIEKINGHNELVGAVRRHAAAMEQYQVEMGDKVKVPDAPLGALR